LPFGQRKLHGHGVTEVLHTNHIIVHCLIGPLNQNRNLRSVVQGARVNGFDFGR